MYWPVPVCLYVSEKVAMDSGGFDGAPLVACTCMCMHTCVMIIFFLRFDVDVVPLECVFAPVHAYA